MNFEGLKALDDVNIDIGKHPTSPGSFEFNGTIDEVSIYNRALSAAEIADLYDPVAIYGYQYYSNYHACRV